MPDKRRPLVRCRQVTRDFHQGPTVVRALRGVDLDVCAGELTLLVGPSGCGKTTLLTIIAGMLQPTSGEVQVLDQNISEMSPGEMTRFRRGRIGFVFQQYNLLPALTAAENAAVPLVADGMAWPEALRQAEQCLASMHLEDRSQALPAQLSGGQQQRVAIARALVHEPPLIVCDEPTAALDAETGQAVMRLMREAALQADRAVLVVTHDPRVYPFADRLAFMEDGHILRIETRTPDLQPTAAHGAL